MNSGNAINAKFGLDLDPLQVAARKATAIAQNMARNVQKAMGPASRALSLLGVALTGAGLIAGARNILKTAGHMQTLHEQTNVSVRAIAQLEQSFEDADSSVEALGRSIFIMQRNLQSKRGVETLEAMHLSLDAIHKMSPEQTFVLLGRRIAEIKDPAAQLNLAMKLFGFQGRRLLSVFKDSGFGNPSKGMKAQAESLEQNAALFDEIGDRMGHLLKVGRGFFLGMMEKLGPILLAVIKKLEDIDIVDVGRQFGDVILSAIKIASGQIANWISVGRIVYKLWTGAAKLFGSGGKALLQALQEALPAVMSVKELLLIAALEFAEFLGKGCAAGVDLLIEGMTMLGSRAQDLAVNFAGSFLGTATSFYEWIAKSGELFLQTVVPFLAELGSGLSKIGQSFKDILLGAMESILSRLWDGFKSVAAMFGGALIYAVTQIINKLAKLPFIGDKFKSMTSNKSLKDTIGDVSKTLGGSAAGQAAGRLKDQGASDTLRGLNGLKDAGVSAASVVATKLKELWDSTKSSVEGMIAKVGEALEPMRKGRWADKDIDEAKKRLSAIWTTLQEKGAEFAKAALKPASEGAQSMGYSRPEIGGTWGHPGWKSPTLRSANFHARGTAVSFVKKRGESLEHFEKRKKGIRDGQDADGKKSKKDSLETTNNLLGEIKQTMEEAWSN
jgi:hypothetical protein